MKNFLRPLAVLGLSCCFSSLAPAALDPSIISADARWVFYSDLNAMRGSAVGQEMINYSRQQQFESTLGLLALNVEKTLAAVGSITAYGSENSTEGALIIQGTADLRKIVEAFLLQATLSEQGKMTVTELKDYPFAAYALAEKSSKAVKPAELIVAFPAEPIILMSKSKAQLLKAHEVFSQRAESLAKVPNGEMGQLVKNAGNAYVYGCSVIIPGKGNTGTGPQARLLQLAHSVTFALGEEGANTFANASLAADSEESAVKLFKIAQGLSAMLALGESQDKDVAAFLNAATVEKNNQSVVMKIAYPSARIVPMLRSAAKVQASAPAASRHKSKP